MKLSKFSIGIIFGLLSIEVHSEPRWQNVMYVEGILVQIDINSVSNTPRDYYQGNKKFWTRQTIIKDLIQDGLAVGDYRMALYEINCEDKTSAGRSGTDYFKQKNGTFKVKNLNIEETTQKMKPIIPGTLGDSILEIVCP